MLAAGDVAVLIERHVKEKIPFCLIRLGDGEGNLLDFAKARAEDLAYFEEHFGGGVGERTIAEIRKNLTDAIGAADLIGLRDDVWLAPAARHRSTRTMTIFSRNSARSFRFAPPSEKTSIATRPSAYSACSSGSAPACLRPQPCARNGFATILRGSDSGSA